MLWLRGFSPLLTTIRYACVDDELPQSSTRWPEQRITGCRFRLPSKKNQLSLDRCRLFLQLQIWRKLVIAAKPRPDYLPGSAPSRIRATGLPDFSSIFVMIESFAGDRAAAEIVRRKGKAPVDFHVTHWGILDAGGIEFPRGAATLASRRHLTSKGFPLYIQLYGIHVSGFLTRIPGSIWQPERKNEKPDRSNFRQSSAALASNRISSSPGSCRENFWEAPSVQYARDFQIDLAAQCCD